MGLFSFLFSRKKTAQALISARLRDANVLELGCKTGELHEQVSSQNYNSWTGVDELKTAIAQAKQSDNRKTSFVFSSISQYVPQQAFSIIIFNQIDISPALLMRYEGSLAPGGVFIVILSQNASIWKQLESRYRVLDQGLSKGLLTKVLSL
ncbi:MAG: methyltransferase domain-containing protein [Siphonobacter sp.]